MPLLYQLNYPNPRIVTSPTITKTVRITSTNHPTASVLSYLKRAQGRLTTPTADVDDAATRLTKATLKSVACKLISQG